MALTDHLSKSIPIFTTLFLIISAPSKQLPHHVSFPLPPHKLNSFTGSDVYLRVVTGGNLCHAPFFTVKSLHLFPGPLECVAGSAGGDAQLLSNCSVSFSLLNFESDYPPFS